MYQALLTRRYLTSKVMPLLAAVAVTLCVAMELIVWSVMGGFLDMLKGSGRVLIGDVAISNPVRGFAHYEDLLKRLEADPLVAGATPTIESAGFLALPLGGQVQTVMVKGIDPASYAKVTKYAESLWWRPVEEPLPKDEEREDPRLDPAARERLAMLERAGMEMRMETVEGEGVRPAMVLGIQVGYSKRQTGGWYDPRLVLPWEDDAFLYVFPVDSGGRPVEAVARNFPVANEYRSGLYEIDAGTVLVPLGELQRMLGMDEAKRVKFGPLRRVRDPVTGRESVSQPEEIEIDPARVTTVLVRGRDTESRAALAALRDRVEAIYAEFAVAHTDVPDMVDVGTWEERHATLIAAVEKETQLVLFIFGVISVTSVFLVLAIFWAMVSEKTRDIGILRAMGASRGGVAWLWLRYGLVIGVVGAILGGGVAYAVVVNINTIHDWLGSVLGVVVWDPRVYYFNEIPNHVETWKAVVILSAGVVASVGGALIPAVKAANMDPVRSLRFE